MKETKGNMSTENFINLPWKANPNLGIINLENNIQHTDPIPAIFKSQ
jgi:hypothetical protein